MDTYVIKRTAVLSGLALIFMLASVASVHAEKAGKGEGKGFYGEKSGWEENVNKMHDKLGLSEEQRMKLRAHKEAHRDEGKVLREQISVKREALHQELQKANLDEAKVRTLNKEVQDLQNKMADHRLNGIMEVRKILTPEQHAQFMEMKGDYKDKSRGEFKAENRGKWKEEGFRERKAGSQDKEGSQNK